MRLHANLAKDNAVIPWPAPAAVTVAKHKAGSDVAVEKA
jgi:hypothetical protein